jgi:hypothetical protein
VPKTFLLYYSSNVSITMFWLKNFSTIDAQDCIQKIYRQQIYENCCAKYFFPKCFMLKFKIEFSFSKKKDVKCKIILHSTKQHLYRSNQMKTIKEHQFFVCYETQTKNHTETNRIKFHTYVWKVSIQWIFKNAISVQSLKFQFTHNTCWCWFSLSWWEKLLYH